VAAVYELATRSITSQKGGRARAGVEATLAKRRWAPGYYGKRNAGWRELSEDHCAGTIVCAT